MSDDLLDVDMDLFAAPAPKGKAAPRKPRATVANFACMCGFRDEVRDPAPERIACPEKDCRTAKRLMYRWTPRLPSPFVSARALTDADLSRT